MNQWQYQLYNSTVIQTVLVTVSSVGANVGMFSIYNNVLRILSTGVIVTFGS